MKHVISKDLAFGMAAARRETSSEPLTGLFYQAHGARRQASRTMLLGHGSSQQRGLRLTVLDYEALDEPTSNSASWIMRKRVVC
ncbi:hypothetical protein BU23DRAFT_163947 [Bimuria novae-zelandiae CBS 107.79]|uniref:Uncharacterized protein n=1 Tax=Bimuria novae-zelandiae CBS 107.79 TaxID=1447943 RepID=A0A6A5V6D8_9PLEO|nr:hypothetical protein BU23DRAFT_163947 [Bimuria novae-zelandiae CBS 107.79]